MPPQHTLKFKVLHRDFPLSLSEREPVAGWTIPQPELADREWERGCEANWRATELLLSPVCYYLQPTYVWYFLSVGAMNQRVGAGGACTQHIDTHRA